MLFTLHDLTDEELELQREVREFLAAELPRGRCAQRCTRRSDGVLAGAGPAAKIDGADALNALVREFLEAL